MYYSSSLGIIFRCSTDIPFSSFWMDDVTSSSYVCYISSFLLITICLIISFCIEASMSFVLLLLVSSSVLRFLYRSWSSFSILPVYLQVLTGLLYNSHNVYGQFFLDTSLIVYVVNLTSYLNFINKGVFPRFITPTLRTS